MRPRRRTSAGDQKTQVAGPGSSGGFRRAGGTRADRRSTYAFNRGFPTPATARRTYDDADFNRAASAPSNTILVGFRSLPLKSDVTGAFELIKTAKIYPLTPIEGWPELKWLDLTKSSQDTTPFA